MPDEPPSNALGLQFSQQTVEDKEPEVPEIVSKSPTSPSESPKKKDVKEKPYVNPDRVKTGGAQRDKLSEEALAEKMARMREQNEKIRLRRLDVQADEEAFRKTQEQDREKQAQNRKIQADIDRARDQNARRKMDKAQYRDWDSGKPSVNKKSGPGPQELTEGMKDSDNAPAGTVDWANAPLNQPAGLEPKEETTTSNDWGPTASETTTQDWGVTPVSSDIQETKDWSGAPITAQDWGLPPSAGDASTTDWSGAPIAAQDWGSGEGRGEGEEVKVWAEETALEAGEMVFEEEGTALDGEGMVLVREEMEVEVEEMALGAGALNVDEEEETVLGEEEPASEEGVLALEVPVVLLLHHNISCILTSIYP
ncbi:hypothetical protein NLJ89_g272 [Agrocybe chaxingu]|uniref:Uncharacterized protein n=1 Tax=Agrocybe chaxingu TaxID=84603 RepID=A0A9W8N259_9AGAR|nr:hypothetical protein NLJ89_g272 [Agrocybe chaxingu]